LAEVLPDVLILQYSIVFDTSNGGVKEVAVGLGVKYSAVHGRVLPALEVRVKLCPLMLPFPTGYRKFSPLATLLISGPLTKDVALPPAGKTASDDGLNNVSLFAEVVLIIPCVSSNSLLISTSPFAPIVNPDMLLISRLLNRLLPEKSPVGPPRVWAEVPAKITVEAGETPEPLMKVPAL
jgi:hypothetical protein